MPKFKRAIASRWVAINPILAAGEPGFEIDTGRMKIGNGINKWTSLFYVVPPSDDTGSTSLSAHISAPFPHPVYDDGPDLTLLYQNSKV